VGRVRAVPPAVADGVISRSGVGCVSFSARRRVQCNLWCRKMLTIGLFKLCDESAGSTGSASQLLSCAHSRFV